MAKVMLHSVNNPV